MGKDDHSRRDSDRDAPPADRMGGPYQHARLTYGGRVAPGGWGDDVGFNGNPDPGDATGKPGGTSAAEDPSPDAQRSDEALCNAIRDALDHDEQIDPGEVSVEVIHAVATLAGTVSGHSARHRAAHLAAEVEGIADVQNDIHVRTAH